MRPASFQDCLVQLVVTSMIFMSLAIPTVQNGRKFSTKSCQPIDGEPPSKVATDMLDIQTLKQPNGEFSIRVSQDAYIESVMDVALSPERWSQQGPLSKPEIAACRNTWCFAMVGHTNPTSTMCPLQLAPHRSGDQWNHRDCQGDPTNGF